MGGVAQASLAAVGLLTPAPLRARERRPRPCPKGARHDRSQAYQPDPVELGAQSDLIGAPEAMSIEAILAAPNGGSARLTVVRSGHDRSQRRHRTGSLTVVIIGVVVVWLVPASRWLLRRRSCDRGDRR
jgi:hypothetical protein